MGPGSAAHHFVLRRARGTHLAAARSRASLTPQTDFRFHPGRAIKRSIQQLARWGNDHMIASLNRYRRIAAAAPLILALTSVASAQTYPSRNITLVLPFAAGSGTDTTTRLISKELGIALGTNMVIDNKAGANGSIAASYVARSAPDGYTLFVTTNTTHSANPYLLKTMSYDPVKDFTPIARTGDLPFMLVINPEIPANSVAELIALAKKDPGKLSYASGSSSAIVSGATFARLAGIDLLHVPYKSSPPALTDVIAGRVSMMFVDVPTGLPHVNGKVLKALAVTTKHRSALLPELPTMDDTVKGFDITSWQGYLGPANMPKEIVTRLNAEIRKIVERPDIKSQLAERGMEAFSGTPEEFDAFLKEQLVLWEKLIADAGIEKQ
jgi:tripartite-type tricarboxylate transporter receptor subunit TctC